MGTKGHERGGPNKPRIDGWVGIGSPGGTNFFGREPLEPLEGVTGGGDRVGWRRNQNGLERNPMETTRRRSNRGPAKQREFLAVWLGDKKRTGGEMARRGGEPARLEWWSSAARAARTTMRWKDAWQAPSGPLGKTRLKHAETRDNTGKHGITRDNTPNA